jgi:hypothetical protein
VTATSVDPSADLLASRPRLRGDVVIGPGLVKGAGTVHHLKDLRTGWYFRVGPREAYLIGRLDGVRTLAEIGEGYTATFGRRLDAKGWTQLLGMLATRRLLVGTDDETELDRMAADAKRRARSGQTLLKARLPLVDPDRFLGRLLPRVRPLFSPWVVVPALLAIVVTEVAILLNAATLAREAAGMWGSPLIIAGVLVVIWLNLAAHEVAHGLTCRHFGGQVPEIGVMWRFPLLFPYCKADDVMLFAARRQRVLVAFAGVYASLLLIVPFAIAYPLLDPGPLRSATAGIVLYGSVAALLNLIPFLQLDGYFMATHALDMVDLRTESYGFLRQVARRVLRRPGPRAVYPRRSRWVYGVYGISSLLFGLAFAAVMLGYWIGQALTRSTLSPTTNALLAVAGAAGGAGVYLWRRRRQALALRGEPAPGEPG